MTDYEPHDIIAYDNQDLVLDEKLQNVIDLIDDGYPLMAKEILVNLLSERHRSSTQADWDEKGLRR